MKCFFCQRYQVIIEALDVGKLLEDSCFHVVSAPRQCVPKRHRSKRLLTLAIDRKLVYCIPEKMGDWWTQCSRINSILWVYWISSVRSFLILNIKLQLLVIEPEILHIGHPNFAHTLVNYLSGIFSQWQTVWGLSQTVKQGAYYLPH